MAFSKKIISTVGEQLRCIREKKNLPLREVASSIGIDTSLLGKIERNERQATKEQVKQLAAYFSIDEKRLLNELLSDQIAYKILEENADLEIFRVAEVKVGYLKNSYNVK